MFRNPELLLLNFVCVCVRVCAHARVRAHEHMHTVSGNRKTMGKKACVSQTLKEKKTIFH